jgi:hypothetical protein
MYTVTVIRKKNEFQTEMLFMKEGQSLPDLISEALEWRETNAPKATVKYSLNPGI